MTPNGATPRVVRVASCLRLFPRAHRATAKRSSAAFSVESHEMINEARSGGLEPPTIRLEGERSIQLSYERVQNVIVDFDAACEDPLIRLC